MLNEAKADELLEMLMDSAHDDLLKAKTPEDKERAYANCKEIYKIYNERLKIQNDYVIAEGKLKLDAEKFDYEVGSEKRSKKEFWIDLGYKICKLTIVGGLAFLEVIMVKNSLIKTNDISKGISKAAFGSIGKTIQL